jgi:hypothetical protein
MNEEKKHNGNHHIGTYKKGLAKTNTLPHNMQKKTSSLSLSPSLFLASLLAPSPYSNPQKLESSSLPPFHQCREDKCATTKDILKRKKSNNVSFHT